MNIEDYREYCLSLGTDVEEKLPFQKFKNGEGVLVFYVMGHMFSFFDCNDFSVISLKCQPERIEDLKTQYGCIGDPYNESSKHWIGVNPNTSPNDLLKELTRNSYEIVKRSIRKSRSNMMIVDTTNMCSHLQRKLFEEDGIYHPLWMAMQDDAEVTAVVQSRQLHIYRNGKKVLVLAGKAAPKVIREDKLCEML